jgi:hypothetical protein
LVHTTRVRALRAGVVVVLAVVGFFLFIRTSRPDPQQLSRLVISHTSVPGLRHREPVLSRSVPAGGSSFAVVRQAAKSNPNETGLYEMEWEISASSPPQAGVLLTLMPNEAMAVKAFDDSVKLLSTGPKLENSTGSKPMPFAVPSVPGARASASQLSSSGKPVGYSYEIDLHFGRVAASNLVVTSNTTFSPSAAIRDAQNEYSVLVSNEPGFSLVQTSTPLTTTIVYVAVAVLIAAGAFFVPELAIETRRRRRERHAERERDRQRSQYRARGRRAVQRHKAPAWRQSARR